MNDVSKPDSFVAEAKQLCRFRYILVSVILFNAALLARIPLAEIRAAGRSGNTEQAAAPLQSPAQPDVESSVGSPSDMDRPDPMAPQPRSTMENQGSEALTEPSDSTEQTALEPHQIATSNQSPGDSSTADPAGNGSIDRPDGQFEPETSNPDSPIDPVRRESIWKDKLHQITHHAIDQVRSRVAVSASRLRQLEISLPEPSAGDDATAQPTESAPSGPGQAVPEEQPTAPNAAERQSTDPTALTLHNPADNDGPIHYLLDGRTCTLEQGETQVLMAGKQRQIRFHRGQDFGVASDEVEQGEFQFIVSPKGWQLIPVR